MRRGMFVVLVVGLTIFGWQALPNPSGAGVVTSQDATLEERVQQLEARLAVLEPLANRVPALESRIFTLEAARTAVTPATQATPDAVVTTYRTAFLQMVNQYEQHSRNVAAAAQRLSLTELEQLVRQENLMRQGFITTARGLMVPRCFADTHAALLNAAAALDYEDRTGTTSIVWGIFFSEAQRLFQQAACT